MTTARPPAHKKARELATHLRAERPDYASLKEVFRHLREELEIAIPRAPQRLPPVPSEDEIQRYYQAVWYARKSRDLVLIKTLLYTGVQVSELVSCRFTDVDLDRCQLRVKPGKGNKDRVVPFPHSFREPLIMHTATMEECRATYLFESSWKKKYSDRGVRKLLARYSQAAGLTHTISPHQLRHFLLTWLKKQGIDDALIQLSSGHASRQSLEIYSRLAIGEAQEEYNSVIDRFPV